MDKKTKNIYAIIFASLIVIANYTVQFPINEWLTYGAIMFPFTFLITDILSEKYSKDEVLSVVKNRYFNRCYSNNNNLRMENSLCFNSEFLCCSTNGY